MSKTAYFSVLIGIGALILLLLAGSVTADTDALPQVEFLGEGPDTFDTPLDDFIVKKGTEAYVFESGPTYEAADGERVWGVSGTEGAPPAVWNSAVDLGPATEGCTVDYRGIDDDENGVRNGFFLGSELIELVIEGMVFEGSFVIPRDGTQFRFVAEESVAGWYTPCEGDEPTPTDPPDATPTTEPTETITPTLPADDGIVVHMPIIRNFGGAETTPTPSEPTPTSVPPTATPVPPTATPPDPTATPPEPTATPVPPTATPPDPTATPTEPASTYNVVCSDDYDVDRVDEEVHFSFSASARENVQPLEDVDLQAELDPGSGPVATNVEETNFNGVADFRITILAPAITDTPVATIRFENQNVYGDDFCLIVFTDDGMLSSR